MRRKREVTASGGGNSNSNSRSRSRSRSRSTGKGKDKDTGRGSRSRSTKKNAIKQAAGLDSDDFEDSNSDSDDEGSVDLADLPHAKSRPGAASPLRHRSPRKEDAASHSSGGKGDAKPAAISVKSIVIRTLS